MLVIRNPVNPQAIEIFDARTHPYHASHVGRARFKFVGNLLYVVFSNVTELIMSPPPWYGGMASSSAALP
jgi:hypothetical protein